MISKKTVFILGAGASADFGYPLGNTLREFIIKSCRGHTKFVENIAVAIGAEDWVGNKADYLKVVNEFGEHLYHHSGYSIDDFLESFSTKYLLVGKLAIAQAIAHNEKHNKLYDTDNWYRILYNKMRRDTTLESFSQNQVSFITFNYDRSLEHFLYTSLSSYDEKIQRAKVIELIEQIPIVHLYGQIDLLDWQAPGGRPYGQEITVYQLKDYKENISIVFEKYTDAIKKQFDKANQLIKEAGRIYILGFGFHENNLERLNHDYLKGRTVIGTAYDLDNEQLEVIKKFWGDYKIREKEGSPDILSFGDQSLLRVKVFDFIKKHGRLN